MKLLMEAKSSNFCAGEFHLDDHGPDFDSISLEWEAGKCPTDNDLRRMIRLEIDSYGREARYRKRVAATSEDTEPVGKDVGFLRDPRPNLYPPLFRGSEEISPDVIGKLKAHVLNALEAELPNPDSFIYFTIYGSGISYNWDEAGDMDVQMWVDIEKYEGEDMTSDDLIATIRRIVQPINFPTFNDLGLESPDDSAEGTMMIQYYPKPGRGTPEENLASKPYACYDLETGEWLEKAKPITPTFYGEHFLMLEPKCEDIALQAEALIGELERNILNWQFWYSMYQRFDNDHYRERYEKAQQNAEQEKAGVIALFEGVFGGRAKAYSPEGKGIEDERDMVQKMLEVWGIFQKLKHYAREALPWEEKEMPNAPKKTAGGDTWDGSPGLYTEEHNPRGLPRPIWKGMPVPWTGDSEMTLDGYVPNFPNTREDRMNQAENLDLCLLCGLELSDPVIVFADSSGGIVDGGLHPRCAKITKAHCPHLRDDDGYYTLISIPLSSWNHGNNGIVPEDNFLFESAKLAEVTDSIYEAIRASGGGTYDAQTLQPAQHSHGFYVGIKGAELKLPVEEMTDDTIEEYAAHTTTPFVGAWISDGYVFLDNVLWVENPHDATILGKQQDQQAIWDIRNQREIWLKKGWAITTMAERTGDPELDMLIEEFKASDPFDRGILDIAQYEELRDPETAEGLCVLLTNAFTGFIRREGIEAWPADSPGTMGGNVPGFFSPDELGYADRKRPGFNSHSAAMVRKDGQTYMIDFTPAQYGYSEFPMVQKLDGQEWQREWTSSLHKTADWQDIQDKAQRLRGTGVTVLRNGYENVVGEVPSESRPGMMHYPEIWRQDPNRGTITLWDCTCEWAGFSWGRTRQWKKFEGRPCAHVLALFWEASTQPIEDDAQTFMPTPEEEIPPPGQLTDALRATVPGQPQQAPVIPGSQPTQPQRAPAPPVSELTTVNEAEDQQLTLPGTFSRWYRASNFMNGDYVRTNVKVDGFDDRETYYVVPRNMIGEVIWADDESAVVIFSINSKALGPHNVRVEAPVESFSLVPRTRGTAPRRRR
jgi:hypothetical protein